jgi:hypothetical protein
MLSDEETAELKRTVEVGRNRSRDRREDVNTTLWPCLIVIIAVIFGMASKMRMRWLSESDSPVARR